MLTRAVLAILAIPAVALIGIWLLREYQLVSNGLTVVLNSMVP